jgi:hypothetical protein
MTLRDSLILIALFGGCGRATSSEAGVSTSPSASAPPATSAAPVLPEGAAQPRTLWRGRYKSEQGSFFVPDASEWSGVKWRGDDAGAGLGEGTLELEIDSASGTVVGTTSGAVGDTRVTGTIVGKEIMATLRRKDPSDRGFTGTLLATRSGEAVTGTMRLSPGDAHVIREATFSLAVAAP